MENKLYIARGRYGIEIFKNIPTLSKEPIPLYSQDILNTPKYREYYDGMDTYDLGNGILEVRPIKNKTFFDLEPGESLYMCDKTNPDKIYTHTVDKVVITKTKDDTIIMIDTLERARELRIKNDGPICIYEYNSFIYAVDKKTLIDYVKYDIEKLIARKETEITELKNLINGYKES